MLVKNLKSITLAGALFVSVVVTSALLLYFVYSAENDDSVNKSALKSLKIAAFIFLSVNLVYLIARVLTRDFKGNPLMLTGLNLLVAAVNIGYGVHAIVMATKIETFEGFVGVISEVEEEVAQEEVAQEEVVQEDVGIVEEPSNKMDAGIVFQLDADLKKKLKDAQDNRAKDNGDVNIVNNSGEVIDQVSFTPILAKQNGKNSGKNSGNDERNAKYTGYVTGSVALSIGCSLIVNTFLGRAFK